MKGIAVSAPGAGRGVGVLENQHGNTVHLEARPPRFRTLPFKLWLLDEQHELYGV